MQVRNISLMTKFSFALFAIVLLAAPRAHAQFPQESRPSYLHAISDLRASRAWIHAYDRPDIQSHLHHATEEISKAIDDIKHVAADDGKDLDYNPPVDARGMAAGPLHEAMRLLNQARVDVTTGQDDPRAHELRLRSLRHIDEARAALEHAMQFLGHP